MQKNISCISCIILAGGKSSRLPNKPFVLLQGSPLILHVFRSMEKYFDDIIISIKESRKQQMKLIVENAKLITDENPAFSPIEGIKSCANEIKNEWFFLVACDMPFAANTVETLASKISSDTDCVIPFCERLQPLCAFYRKNAFENADINKSLTGFAESLKKEVVYISEKKWFLNINTKEDLERVKQ